MDFKEYQQDAERTMDKENSFKDKMIEASLGLTGEAGEVADCLKKVLYQGHDLDAQCLVGELGDVLWYVTLAANAVGMTLQQIAEFNIRKRKHRYPSGFSVQHSIDRTDNL